MFYAQKCQENKSLLYLFDNNAMQHIGIVFFYFKKYEAQPRANYKSNFNRVKRFNNNEVLCAIG